MKVTIEGDETKLNRLLKKISSRVKHDGLKLTVDSKARAEDRTEAKAEKPKAKKK